MTRARHALVRRCFGARFILALLLPIDLVACGTYPKSGPYDTPPIGARDTARAQELNREAVELMSVDILAAERLLKSALTEDLYFGPAHNNLGVAYLKQEKLYEAANEFEWARKLMPGHPDPRMNLGLTLERAMRIDDALTAYSSALEVYTDHIWTQQALARAQIESGRMDARTKLLLEDIAMKGETREWRDWAKSELLEVDR